MLKITKAYDSFKQWDNTSQRVLLGPHIPERNERKRVLQDACEGIHCFVAGKGEHNVKSNIKVCVHCGFRTHNQEIIARGLKRSDPAKIEKFKEFMAWDNERARALLADQIQERKVRLKELQALCEEETGHAFSVQFNAKRGRKEQVCRHCKLSCAAPKEPSRQEKLAKFKTQIAEKQSC